MKSTTALTFEQFEQLPDEPGKQELLNGELITLPPASERHSRIAHRVFRLIDRHCADIRMETGYRLGSSVWVQPDVSLPHPDQAAGTYLEGGPKLAIEILSPANRAPDVQHKLQLYFEYGTREVWLIYPDTHIIEVHSAQGSTKHDAAFESALLPGLVIDPAALLA
jgi:Uma2 family endonuclease